MVRTLLRHTCVVEEGEGERSEEEDRTGSRAGSDKRNRCERDFLGDVKGPKFKIEIRE